MKTYTVSGRWPFPLDMLRYDQAEPADEDSKALIDRLSAEHADAQTIKAVFEVRLTSEDRYAPHHQRWESFGWEVVKSAATPAPKDAQHSKMVGAHTEGRWEVSEDKIRIQAYHRAGRQTIAYTFVRGKDGGCNQTEAVAEANARRIVACVNACAGLPTEPLERLVAGGGRLVAADFIVDAMDSQLEQAETQRDDLLKALERLANAAFSRDVSTGDVSSLIAAQAELRGATKVARAAIAAVKGGAA